jgi:hypothetical protein
MVETLFCYKFGKDLYHKYPSHRFFRIRLKKSKIYSVFPQTQGGTREESFISIYTFYGLLTNSCINIHITV